ncbi:transcriptional regulator [Sesbania bispinosa]|nr:transcriptional regulator [Sesbania bispinosa]
MVEKRGKQPQLREKLLVGRGLEGSSFAHLEEEEPQVEGNDGGDGEELAAGGNEEVQGDVQGRRPHVTIFIPPNVEDMHVMDEDYNFEELLSGGI